MSGKAENDRGDDITEEPQGGEKIDTTGMTAEEAHALMYTGGELAVNEDLDTFMDDMDGADDMQITREAYSEKITGDETDRGDLVVVDDQRPKKKEEDEEDEDEEDEEDAADDDGDQVSTEDEEDDSESGDDEDEDEDSDESDDSDDDDEDDEDDADESAASDDDDDGDDDSDDDGESDEPGPVPSFRLRQEAARRRRAEDENKRLQAELEAARAGTTVPKANEPAVFEAPDHTEDLEKHTELVLDGKHKEAAALMQKMQSETAQAAVKFATEQSATDAPLTARAERERLDLDDSILDLEAAFAVLDPDSDSFDENLIGEVNSMRIGFQQDGYTPSEAVLQAAEYAINAHYPELLKDDEPKPEKDDEPKPNPEKVKVAKKKQRAKLAAKVKKANREPTDIPASKRGDEPTELDTAYNLSEDEFDKLTDAEMAAIRGDEVE